MAISEIVSEAIRLADLSNQARYSRSNASNASAPLVTSGYVAAPSGRSTQQPAPEETNLLQFLNTQPPEVVALRLARARRPDPVPRGTERHTRPDRDGPSCDRPAEQHRWRRL